MTDGSTPENIFYLRPTPEDFVIFGAVGTPLEHCFREGDKYPIEFPELNEGEHLVFDYDYDSQETNEVVVTLAVVPDIEIMRNLHQAVKLNWIGVIGWRVVNEPLEPEIEQ